MKRAWRTVVALSAMGIALAWSLAGEWPRVERTPRPLPVAQQVAEGGSIQR